jgi:hypothetical protein
MSDSLRAQIDASIGQLRALIRRGSVLMNLTQQSQDTRNNSGERIPSTNSANSAWSSDGQAERRIWQNDCASLVNDLSGGSKAHWLSRAFRRRCSCDRPTAALPFRRTRATSSRA